MTETAIKRAAYDLMHRSGPGLAEIAVWLRKSASTLQNEVNPNVEGHKLGLLDAVEATVFTGNLVALNAFAVAAGCAVLPLPHDDPDSPMERDIALLARRFSTLIERTSTARVDAVVTDNEFAACQRAFADLVAAGQQTLRHLAASNASAKARAAS